MPEIPELNPIVSLDGPELFAARDDQGDVNISADQLATFINNELTPTEALNKVIAANPQLNGLNANLLQGLAASYFTNSSNQTSGSLPSARLPQGDFNYSWTAGSGVSATEGSLKCSWKFPLFVSNGSPAGIMLQFGWTNFVLENQTVVVTFLEGFTSFLGNANKPFILLSPECYSTSTGQPKFKVEVDMRLDNNSKSLYGFRCHSIRSEGGEVDYVRGNWLAIGFYN